MLKSRGEWVSGLLTRGCGQPDNSGNQIDYKNVNIFPNLGDPLMFQLALSSPTLLPVPFLPPPGLPIITQVTDMGNFEQKILTQVFFRCPLTFHLHLVSLANTQIVFYWAHYTLFV